MGSKINLSVKGNFSSEKNIFLIFAPQKLPKFYHSIDFGLAWNTRWTKWTEILAEKSILEKIVDEKGPKVKWEPK